MPDDFPPVRFPRKLRDELQESANDLAKERGRQKMSIAEFVAEMHQKRLRQGAIEGSLTMDELELDNILVKLQNAGIELGLQGAPDNTDPSYSLKDARTDLNKLISRKELEARLDELEKLLEGDNTLQGSLLRVPDHPDDVRVVDVSSEWLADELNYRPRRAIVEMIKDRKAQLERVST